MLVLGAAFPWPTSSLCVCGLDVGKVAMTGCTLLLSFFSIHLCFVCCFLPMVSGPGGAEMSLGASLVERDASCRSFRTCAEYGLMICFMMSSMMRLLRGGGAFPGKYMIGEGCEWESDIAMGGPKGFLNGLFLLGA